LLDQKEPQKSWIEEEMVETWLWRRAASGSILASSGSIPSAQVQIARNSSITFIALDTLFDKNSL
jgi:hypothetical protein